MTIASSVRHGTPTLLSVVAMVAVVMAVVMAVARVITVVMAVEAAVEVAMEVADLSVGQSPAAMSLIRQVRATLGATLGVLNKYLLYMSGALI